MTKDFLRINIPKLPVFTTEEGIKTIKQFYGELNDWKQISSLIPPNYLSPNLKKTGHAGIFSAALELVREGNISIKQKSLFEEIYIKEN
jgi:Uncharacterized conserved protein